MTLTSHSDAVIHAYRCRKSPRRRRRNKKKQKQEVRMAAVQAGHRAAREREAEIGQFIHIYLLFNTEHLQMIKSSPVVQVNTLGLESSGCTQQSFISNRRRWRTRQQCKQPAQILSGSGI